MTSPACYGRGVMSRRRATAVTAIAAALAALLLLACKKDEAKGGGKAATGAPPAGVKVALVVDGKPALDVDPGRAAQYPPIGALLAGPARDPSTWSALEVRPRQGEARTLTADEQKGKIAALYPDRGGTAFGLFSPEELAKKARPAIAVTDVAEVRITLAAAKEGGGGGGDSGGGGDHGGGGGDDERPRPTADLKITIKGPAGEVVFTGDKLNDLATVTAPSGDTETPGWTIPAILKAAGVEPTGKLFLVGEEGASLLLEPGDLDPATTMLYVKLNRQGQLRFRVFKKQGEVWDVTGELRGIKSIELK